MRQTSHQPLSDDALVALCLERGARDDRPFQELMQRHHQMIWRVCYSYFANIEDAEDLTQDVFFKIYRSLAQFEGRSSFKTWIYRIALNVCQNEARQRGRRPLLEATDVETMAETLPGTAPLETTWQEAQQSELFHKTWAALPADIAELLWLKDVEQRPYQEIADLLTISLSAAKMRVQRARLTLQAQYKLHESVL
jgi:RNA polymerase sigma-70 factor (ECF subfamily)